MSDEEVEKWRRDNEIHCQGDNIPKPFLSFDVSPFPCISFLFLSYYSYR